MRLPLVAGAIIALVGSASADPRAGERAFQRCYACHSVVEGEDKLPGPNLRGVVGRRAGTLPDFEFSPAMVFAGQKRGLVWTRATLEAFMADPETLVLGTTMSMPPLKDARERARIVEYLETAR